MNIKKILCPIDFSEPNQTANDYACLLASATKAEIVYLNVALGNFANNMYVDREQEEIDALKQLKEIKPTQAGIEFSHVVQIGMPAETIIEYARDNQIDLIVMATHGRTGLSRAIMGSIAESVVRKAECPVLAIKAGVTAGLSDS